MGSVPCARQDARVPEGERQGQRKEVATPGQCLLSSNLAPLDRNAKPEDCGDYRTIRRRPGFAKAVESGLGEGRLCLPGYPLVRRWRRGPEPAQAVLGLGENLEIAEVMEFCAATFGALARGGAYERIWQTPAKTNEARWAEDDAVRKAAGAEEEKVQANLLHDIFGSHTSPTLTNHPAVLAWNDRLVVRLAQVIYKEQRWGTLPVLADANQSARRAEEAWSASSSERSRVTSRFAWPNPRRASARLCASDFRDQAADSASVRPRNSSRAW